MIDLEKKINSISPFGFYLGISMFLSLLFFMPETESVIVLNKIPFLSNELLAFLWILFFMAFAFSEHIFLHLFSNLKKTLIILSLFFLFEAIVIIIALLLYTENLLLFQLSFFEIFLFYLCFINSVIFIADFIIRNRIWTQIFFYKKNYKKVIFIPLELSAKRTIYLMRQKSKYEDYVLSEITSSLYNLHYQEHNKIIQNISNNLDNFYYCSYDHNHYLLIKAFYKKSFLISQLSTIESIISTIIETDTSSGFLMKEINRLIREDELRQILKNDTLIPETTKKRKKI